MKFISKDNFKEHLRKKFLNKKSTWHIGFISFLIVLLIYALFFFSFKINSSNKGNWDERPTLTLVKLSEKDVEQSTKNKKQLPK